MLNVVYGDCFNNSQFIKSINLYGMKIYLNETDAIGNLHKKGYNNDFQLFGNDLLWIQRKIFIRAVNFSIEECHRFLSQAREGKEIIVFGIIVPKYNAKGIMLNDYSDYTASMPLIVAKKLEEMYSFTG